MVLFHKSWNRVSPKCGRFESLGAGKGAVGLACLESRARILGSRQLVLAESDARRRSFNPE